jgi:transcriptional regulator with XRE-family HTH domain
MKRSKILEKVRKVRAKYIDVFVDNTFDLSGRIQYLLDKNGMEQKDLAKELKKNESEISKWLSGSHNFTLKTLAKIEAVLGERLLEVVDNEVAKANRIEVFLLKQSTVYQPKHFEKSDDKFRRYSSSSKYEKNYTPTC